MRFLLHTYQRFIVGSVVCLMVVWSFASAEKVTITVPYTPETLVARDTVPTLTAAAFAIFDVQTGAVLVARNADAVLPIASVTKLLTAATVLRTVDATNTYTVTEDDLSAHGRAGQLKAGELYPAHELLFPLLLESSNDAAAVFERATAGDIIRRMNGYAAELGAQTLTVVDASGLSTENRASVTDLVTLTSALYTREPRVFDIAQLSKRAGLYTVWTNNSPVRDGTYRGGKHGFTEAANRTLVAVFNESFAAGIREVGYVLLSSDDLAADVATLRTFVAEHVTLE